MNLRKHICIYSQILLFGVFYSCNNSVKDTNVEIQNWKNCEPIFFDSIIVDNHLTAQFTYQDCDSFASPKLVSILKKEGGYFLNIQDKKTNNLHENIPLFTDGNQLFQTKVFFSNPILVTVESIEYGKEDTIMTVIHSATPTGAIDISNNNKAGSIYAVVKKKIIFSTKRGIQNIYCLNEDGENPVALAW